MILDDFPLLDRRQPPIVGEKKSTITRDYLLAQAANRFSIKDKGPNARVELARAGGALPYIPSEMLPSELQLEEVNS